MAPVRASQRPTSLIRRLNIAATIITLCITIGLAFSLNDIPPTSAKQPSPAHAGEPASTTPDLWAWIAHMPLWPGENGPTCVADIVGK